MPTFPFFGVIQNYAWGGYDFLTDFLAIPKKESSPKAEYWMGAHDRGPAQIIGTEETLDQLIARNPHELLGEKVASHFANHLPFLFKILDVNKMLSIQVHPTKAAAAAGFAREEAQGLSRTAPNRNYRDDNHKPELGVALNDFYLLHGFKTAEAIQAALTQVPGWGGLKEDLESQGVKGLYRKVMEADQATINVLLNPLVNSLQPKAHYTRDQPEFWATRAVQQYSREGNHDRGIFSIYWFNIVHLSPGQGIFQDAGIPHAYLEGSCIELMANSDNVLRGGLTPKHIDVQELLDKTSTSPVQPALLHPEPGADGWAHYPTPAPDFHLSLIEAEAGANITLATPEGPAILLLMKGGVTAKDGGTSLNEGQRTVFVPAGQSITLLVQEKCLIYRASVNI